MKWSHTIHYQLLSLQLSKNWCTWHSTMLYHSWFEPFKHFPYSLFLLQDPPAELLDLSTTWRAEQAGPTEDHDHMYHWRSLTRRGQPSYSDKGRQLGRFPMAVPAQAQVQYLSIMWNSQKLLLCYNVSRRISPRELLIVNLACGKYQTSLLSFNTSLVCK